MSELNGDVELPAGWALTTLDSVANWGSGGTPKAGTPEFYGGDIPWAIIGDLSDGPLVNTRNCITGAGLANSSAKWVPEGAVLVAMYGSIGKLGIAKRSITTNQAIAFAIPVPDLIDTGYLFWFLRSARDSLVRAGRGGTQQNISQTILKAWPIPVPPLAEQRRIVETLEDHLSRLDAAERLTRSAKRRFRSLTTSVVQAALDACSPYPTEILGQLIREPLRNGHSARATSEPGGIRTLTLTAVTLNDFSDQNTKITEADPARVKDLWLEPGDILIQRSNTPELVGTSALYNGLCDWAIYPDLLIRVRTTSRLTPEFAALVLQSKRVRSFFRAGAKGLAGTMPKIDQATISSVRIPVPPIEVQRRLVADVSERLDQAAHAVSQLEDTTRRANCLRSALLKSAFAGKLVPQDPTDEPASVLLDRIRAEREAQGTSGKPKRATRRPRKPTTADAPPPPPPPAASSSAPTTAVQQELPL